MTHDADHDPEFEAFLKRRSLMHRRLAEMDRAEIDSAEPPSELDRLVLNRAREAISTPTREPIYRSPKWAMPLGLAATILIAFTVVLNIDHRNAIAPNAQVASSASPEAAAAPVAEDANEVARASDVPASAPSLAKAAAAEIAERSSAERKRVLEEPARVAAERAANAEMLAGRTASLMHEEDATDSDADAASSDSVDSAPAEAIAQAASPEGRLRLRSERVGALTDSSRAASPSAPLTAAARSAAPGYAAVPPAPPPAPASAAGPAPAGEAASSASATSAALRANPEAWLQEINRLRAAGKGDEADRELTAFREAYPSHPGYSVAKPPSR